MINCISLLRFYFYSLRNRHIGVIYVGLGDARFAN